ncbi:hypothetical protein FE257_000181 [Aspergillus nanangensis]|uniref:Citrate exporter 1 n=1 Tax=Aspergillus nanangensis TaxID=2582783 RepID=A0AAD4D0N8_ASPNN|nr:hypothetical protein FE257_000181 [Aspergillus nanangensis]
MKILSLISLLSLAAKHSHAASLNRVLNFGANPGSIQMYIYVPDNLAPNPPIIVALHGCLGTARGYYNSVDFHTPADSHGFIAIFPGSTQDFNCWDVNTAASLTHNGGSDSLSIVNMVKHTISKYNADPRRVFVTGSSSGAMMTQTLLAAYPDVFAAGSAFSGLPYGCLRGSPGSSPFTADQACAEGEVTKSGEEWAAGVREAWPGYNGSYPRLQVWHGTADSIIAYSNLGEEIKQWETVFGVGETGQVVDSPEAGYTRRPSANAIKPDVRVLGPPRGAIAPSHGFPAVENMTSTATHDADLVLEVLPSVHGSSNGEKSTEKSPDSAVLERSPTAHSEGAYSAFTRSQKRYIVFCASWAGFFSPVSSQIYYPALNTLAHDLHVSSSLINLTLTSYMIFQGLSPMFVGDFADKAGRRPAYLICFLVYIAANIGLAVQDNYAALFVLRCVQSAGISTTIALSSGVVADIAVAAERGSYMGFVTAGSLLGPSVGPIIGGLLAQYLGWRAIFWFLTIFAGAFTVQFVLFFPETARRVVGDGSIPPPLWNISWINYYHLHHNRSKTTTSSTPAPQKLKLGFPNPLRTLSIVFQKDTSIILFANAVLFAGFYDVSASIPAIYQELYGLNDLQIGLCYIPFGFGATIASIATGKTLDYNYRRLAKRLGFPLHGARRRDLKGFPIEKARLQLTFPLLAVGGCTVIAFGWVLDYGVHLAAPTSILFVMGLSLTGAFNTVSTLLVDLYPSNASAATASNNFVRCLLGAGATALIDPMLEAMGRGWCFTFVALVMLATAPLLWVVIRFGPRWREERLESETRRTTEGGERWKM